MKTKLPSIFDGQTVTIVGGGSSLNGFDFSRVMQPAIAINSSFMKCESKCLVAIDPVWEKEFSWELKYYDGLRVSYNGRGMTTFHEVELDEDPEPFGEDWCILKANLSGIFALSLAFHLGAARVVLLGYDGGYIAGKSNHYPVITPGGSEDNYTNANEYFNYFVRSHRNDILNVGMDSRITSFTKAPIESNFYELI